ncbi:hypothetical protein B0H14DRAFT_3890678 [Mycena olivaceomarginata]|nr:hypothetical protein B0H14DRAFT_3890678 [Mycena olivaceomarginata]
MDREKQNENGVFTVAKLHSVPIWVDPVAKNYFEAAVCFESVTVKLLQSIQLASLGVGDREGKVEFTLELNFIAGMPANAEGAPHFAIAERHREVVEATHAQGQISHHCFSGALDQHAPPARVLPLEHVRRFGPRLPAQDDDNAEYAASAMVILKMFGLTDKAESFVGGNVNKHFNTFTMAANLHYFFDHLKFWLEEVIGGKQKFLCEAIVLHANRRASSSPRDIQVDPDIEAACRANNKPVPTLLPSPTLLAIRAACSRIAHMSGAAE